MRPMSPALFLATLLATTARGNGLEVGAVRSIKPSACAAAQADRTGPVGRLLVGGAECTGTLLGPTVVLTAAHCAWQKKPADLRFSLAPSTGKFVAVRAIVLHPSFAIPRRGEAIGPDLALLQLESDGYGRKAPFFPPAIAAEAIGTGGKGWVVGFGLEEKGSSGTRHAKEVTLADGKDVVGVDRRVVPNGMLRFYRGSTGETACPGDSGGPVLAEARGVLGIVGVVSAGKLEEPRAVALARRSAKNRALYFCRHAETLEAVATAPYFDWIQETLTRLETKPTRNPCAGP